jgi:hypothetical protein
MHLRQKFLSTIAAVAIAVPMLTLSAPKAQAGIFISIGFAPPELPVYVQPPLPQEGYIWTPGYWAYGDYGYFWVPGTWVEAPQPGYLWTPGYWGYDGGMYGWHEGYWGEHVGYYGGVNYGFGYGGIGFFGGEWRGGRFAYNSAVSNFGGVHVTNVYVNTTIIHENTIINVNHVSYNGPGGINHPPSTVERQYSTERHIQPTPNQSSHITAASQDRSQLASVNHGRPATTAVSNVAAYHAVAETHAKTMPFTPADKAAAKVPPVTKTSAAGHEAPPKPATATPPPVARPAMVTAPKVAPRTEAAPRTAPVAPRTEVAPRPAPAPAVAPRTVTAPRPVVAPRTETAPRTEAAPKAAPRAVPPPKQAPKPAAHPEPKPEPRDKPGV